MQRLCRTKIFYQLTYSPYFFLGKCVNSRAAIGQVGLWIESNLSKFHLFTQMARGSCSSEVGAHLTLDLLDDRGWVTKKTRSILQEFLLENNKIS